MSGQAPAELPAQTKHNYHATPSPDWRKEERADTTRTTFRVSVSREDVARVSFLRSLASDLRSVDIPAVCRVNRDKLLFEGTVPSSIEGNTAKTPSLIRTRQVASAQSVIDRVKQSELNGLFISPTDLDPSRILPVIHFCTRAQDALLYSYCRLSQGVPSARRIGRQIRALVLDEGQARLAIMGVIGLASSTYMSHARDEYLGWNGRESKAVRESGLRRLMTLAVCMAVPPYSSILGGKLMALLAFSQPFCDEFQRKYRDELLALETTCARGLHCPIFHRLSIRPGGLYRRIGQTAGYSTYLFSTGTVRAARELVAQTRGKSEGILSGSTKPMVMLRYALRACELPEEAFLMSGNPKGIYFAIRTPECTDFLEQGIVAKPPVSFSKSEAVEYWRLHLLPKRAGLESVRHPEASSADTAAVKP
jgi:hypothetical protein